jgi:hypothetical protein
MPPAYFPNLPFFGCLVSAYTPTEKFLDTSTKIFSRSPKLPYGGAKPAESGAIY